LKFAASVNQACCVFSGKLKIQYKFLFFWLLGYRPQIISLASGGGQPNVNQDILRGLRVACPDLSEQNTIVTFLETELLKFDTLTAEAQRAIDLLQERRTALAEHERFTREITSLRARAVKEAQLNRRVELNLEVKRLEARLAEVSNTL